MPLGQLCLTDLGNFELTDYVDIYSNVDGFQIPFATNVLVESLSSSEGNCPYLLVNVPEGTTEIYIVTTEGDVCLFLPVQSSELCEECDFGFSEYSATSVGRLYVGNLTASCENELTDYAIDWYNSNNEFVFSSGIGDLFDYQYQQPALGNSGVFVPPGVYSPLIREILINGIVFTSIESSDDNIFAVLDCLPNIEVVVTAYTCDNGDSTDDVYSHVLTFEGVSSNAESIPEVMPVHLLIDSDVNYIAWAFEGENVPDEIKVIFSGSSYPNAFILDWFKVGAQNITTDFSLPLPWDIFFPLNSDEKYLKKVNCLTAFTINEGDTIIFEIVPNQTNFNTDWTLKFKCLDSFNCNSCSLSGSGRVDLTNGFTINTLQGCGDRKNFVFNMSGSCYDFNDDLNNFYQTDTFYSPNSVSPTYTNLGIIPTGLNMPTMFGNGQYTLQSGAMFYPYQSCNSGVIGMITACATPSNNTITFSKTYNAGNNQALIYMTFTSQVEFNSYWNNYLTTLQSLPTTQDLNDPDYYECYVFVVRPQTSVNTPCGDNSPPAQQYFIPKNATFISGLTNEGNYYLQVEWGPIVNGLDNENCCYSPVVITNVSLMNSSLTSNNISFTNNRGSRPQDPIGRYNITVSTSINTGSTAGVGYFAFQKQLNETVPRNYNDPNQFYPQYSSVTCPNLYNLLQSNNQPNYYSTNFSFWRVELINPLDNEEFRMIRLLTTGNQTAFVYSGGTINEVDSNYVIQ